MSFAMLLIGRVTAKAALSQQTKIRIKIKFARLYITTELKIPEVRRR
jgi:hypothetical protein